MVDAVEEQALVFMIGGEIGLVEERVGDGQAGLEVFFSGGLFAFCCEVGAEAEKPLRGDGGGGAVDGFVGVVGIGVFLGDVTELVAVEGHGIPIGHAVFRGVAVDVVVARGAGGLEEEIGDGAATADGVEIGTFGGIQKLELLGVAGDNPGGTARPRGERRVALLRGRTAELTVVAIEDGFVGDASADIVAIAALAEEDVETCGGGGVFDGPVEEIRGLVALAH